MLFFLAGRVKKKKKKKKTGGGGGGGGKGGGGGVRRGERELGAFPEHISILQMHGSTPPRGSDDCSNYRMKVYSKQ